MIVWYIHVLSFSVFYIVIYNNTLLCEINKKNESNIDLFIE